MVNRTNYYGVKLKHKASAHSMLRDNPVVNLRMNRKGAAELLLEIILSTVIFFVIIVFIFAIKVLHAPLLFHQMPRWPVRLPSLIY